MIFNLKKQFILAETYIRIFVRFVGSALALLYRILRRYCILRRIYNNTMDNKYYFNLNSIKLLILSPSPGPTP